jgi:two-component system LytT family response regulator
LQADHRFIRSHKSYIVNFEEIISFSKSDGGWIDLSIGNSLPVSNEKTSEIIERLNIVKRQKAS